MSKSNLKQLLSVEKYIRKQSKNNVFELSHCFHKRTQLAIVIPAYKESIQDITAVLNSLQQQETDSNFQVILVVNHSSDETNEIKNHHERFVQEIGLAFETNLSLNIISAFNLNPKKAGVGLARKIGMDAALQQFYLLGTNGIISCLDADSPVSHDYVNQIIKFFSTNKEVAVSINFEHPLSEDLPIDHRNAITDYELHLRYYIHIQQHFGLPYAIQTVGSALAVRAWDYAGEGGMPQLQAGEDFYFLQKYISKSKCGEICNPLVFPSGRTSNRVPFGTGKAVNDILSSNAPYESYQIDSFLLLKTFINLIFESYPKELDINKLQDYPLYFYFENLNIASKYQELLQNTTTKELFQSRFYQWFDAFKLMKYLHFMRDQKYPNKLILEVVNEFQNLKAGKIRFDSNLKALKYYRELDRLGKKG